MNNSQLTTIRRLHAKHWSVRDIAVATGFTRARVQRAIGVEPPKRTRTAQSVARSLLAEGYSPELVAANFGEA